MELDLKPLDLSMYVGPCPRIEYLRTLNLGTYRIEFLCFEHELSRKPEAEVIVLPPISPLDKIREFVVSNKRSRAMIICPLIATKLNEDINGATLYGTERFWREAISRNIVVEDESKLFLKDNLIDIVTKLGKGYLALLRVFNVPAPGVAQLLDVEYLYAKCFKVREEVVLRIKEVNKAILLSLVGPTALPPLQLLDAMITYTPLRNRVPSNINIEIEVNDNIRADFEIVSRLHPRGIALENNRVVIRGLF